MQIWSCFVPTMQMDSMEHLTFSKITGLVVHPIMIIFWDMVMRFGQTLDMEMMWLSLAMSRMLWMNHWWGRPFGACGQRG